MLFAVGAVVATQRTGEQFVKDWLEQNCQLSFVDEKGPIALSDFTKFLASKRCEGQLQLVDFSLVYYFHFFGFSSNPSSQYQNAKCSGM